MLYGFDDWTRERLVLVVDTPLSGARVARALDWSNALCGTPLSIVGANGTWLTSMAILKCVPGVRIERHYIAPGKPQQDGFKDRLMFAAAANASTRCCSPRSRTPARGWRRGATTATMFGRTAGSAGCRLRLRRQSPTGTKTAPNSS